MNIQFKFYLFFIFYFVAQANFSFSFNTLQELHLHVLSLEEFPSIDNIDWTFPDFTTYYRSIQRGFLSKFAESTGMHRPYWSMYQFQELLTKVTESREKQKSRSKYPLEQTSLGQKYIIWGELHGAIHSLDRCLQYLLEQGIITDDFIISQDYKFVFNGNAINRGAHSCQTLTVILTLMEKNPDRVFYIKGIYETDDYWKDVGIAWELQIKGSQILREDISFLDAIIIKIFNILPISLFIPLEDILTRFLDTLPTTIFLSQEQEESNKVVLMSGFTPEHIVKKNNELLNNHKILNSVQSDNGDIKNKDIQAYILSENRKLLYQQTNGLIQLDDIQGKRVWSVFSSPIQAHQELYDFFYDAFAILTIKDSIDEWTLQLVHHDIKDLGGFKKEKEVLFVSSDLVAQKHTQIEKEQLSKKDFVIGCTLDLSRGNIAHGMQTKAGTELWLTYEKREKNIVPEIIYQDDAYSPSKAYSNIEKFLAQGIDTIINSPGSANAESYLDIIKSGQLLSLFPITGAYIFRNPDLKYIIHFRRGYKDEGEVLLTYAYEKLQAHKFAIFYQNDSMGISALEGALEVKNKFAITDDNWLQVSYNRNDTWYENQYEAIKNFNPDTILFFSTAFVARNFIQQTGIDFFIGKRLLGISDLEEYSFSNFIEKKGLQFILTSVTPDPDTSQLPIAQLFQDLAQKENVIIDTVSFESFITTAILMDAFKNIQGPITKEALITYMEKYNNYNLHGLHLTFNPQTRELSNSIWLYTQDKVWEKFDR